MKTFTVSHNVVHLWQGRRRIESERVSQVLLGATVSVLDEAEDGWVYVESDDTYRGWTERRLLMTPGPNNAPRPSNAPRPPGLGELALVYVPFADVRDRPREGSNLVVRLSIGSRLSVQGGENSG